MKLKLDMSCHLLNAYTKFQIDISKHIEKKSGKLGWTDGRTDGQTDGHCHSIIRPFFKRAYKKDSLCSYMETNGYIGAIHLSLTTHIILKLSKPIGSCVSFHAFEIFVNYRLSIKGPPQAYIYHSHSVTSSFCEYLPGYQVTYKPKRVCNWIWIMSDELCVTLAPECAISW